MNVVIYVKIQYSENHQNKHEGIRYSCEICEFVATQPAYLKNTNNQNTKELDILATSALMRQISLMI